jgi:hypothetical protein
VNRRRTAVLGVLLIAGLGLAACTTAGTPGTGTTTTTPPQVSAADALTSALGKLKGQGYDVALNQEGNQVSGHASVDPAKNSATQEIKGTVGGQMIDLAATQIDTNLWLKLDFGALNAQAGIDPTKWMLVDQSKITKADSKPFNFTGPDALGLAALLTSVTDVQRTDATHLTGTVDLTKATGPIKPSDDDIKAASGAAAAVPFTVTLDDQGRLTELKITADASHSALSEDFVFSNYGSPSAISAPAPADVVPASDTVYQILNA